jgi:hypothetical protein
MLQNLPKIEEGVVVFRPLLAFFTFLWYLCSVFLMKSGGPGPNEME